MAEKLEVITAFNIGCSGCDSNGRPVLREKEPVIVKVYKNGASQVLCRYLFTGVADRCNPILDKSKHEDDLEVCPYSTKR